MPTTQFTFKARCTSDSGVFYITTHGTDSAAAIAQILDAHKGMPPSAIKAVRLVPITASTLKYRVENRGHESHFFTRETMRFFGDTMRNYGVRFVLADGAPAWELFRRKPVKHGMRDSAYFCAREYRRLWPQDVRPVETI